MRRGWRCILYCVLLEFKLSTSEDQIFFWEGENLVQPDNLTDESLEYRYLPVIEGEEEEVTCSVRAISEAPYKVTVYHEDFNASVTEERNNKYVKEDIIVNIVDSASIDEKEILCEINEPTQDTISLLVKAYVFDRIVVPKKTCDSCEGLVTSTLRRPKGQKAEDAKFEQKMKEKLKNKFGATSVEIDSNGTVSAEISFTKTRRSLRGGLRWTVDGEDVKDIDKHCDCETVAPSPRPGKNTYTMNSFGVISGVVITLLFVVLSVVVYKKRSFWRVSENSGRN